MNKKETNLIWDFKELGGSGLFRYIRTKKDNNIIDKLYIYKFNGDDEEYVQECKTSEENINVVFDICNGSLLDLNDKLPIIKDYFNINSYSLCNINKCFNIEINNAQNELKNKIIDFFDKKNEETYQENIKLINENMSFYKGRLILDEITCISVKFPHIFQIKSFNKEIKLTLLLDIQFTFNFKTNKVNLESIYFKEYNAKL